VNSHHFCCLGASPRLDGHRVAACGARAEAAGLEASSRLATCADRQHSLVVSSSTEIAQLSYEPDEHPKRKHHWDKDHPGFVALGGVLIGKCPANASLQDAEATLRSGLPLPSERPYPKRIYNVGTDGALYRFTGTNPGRSYHGFPAPGRELEGLPRGFREALRARAESLGCSAQFDRWIRHNP